MNKESICIVDDIYYEGQTVLSNFKAVHKGKGSSFKWLLGSLIL